jgi:hypothetical protein
LHQSLKFALLSLAERHALLLTAAVLSGAEELSSRFFSWPTSWRQVLTLLGDRLSEVDRGELMKRQGRWG